MATTKVGIVYKFFKDGYTNLSEFKKDWDALSQESKDQLAEGIENGSLTY